MPSSYGRSIAAAVFVLTLTFSPYAHAADASAFGMNDPFMDAFQLWATVLTSIESLSQQLASTLEPASSLTVSRSPERHASKDLTPPALAASAVLTIEALPETATTSGSASGKSIAPQQPQSRSPPKTPPATNNSSLALAAATPASAFVTEGQFNAALSALGTSVRQILVETNTNPTPEYIAGDGNNANPYAAAGAIDQLANVTIANPTITGGNVTATSFSGLLAIGDGGTGLSAVPTYGQLLVGNGSGGYTLVATSSLGITGGGGGGTPGGADTQVQFDSGGGFAGSSNFTFSSSTNKLAVTNASTTNITSSYASTSNLIASNSFTLGNVTGILHAVAGVVSASLVNLASDVTGILPVANGGTGWSSLAAGSIPYGNGASALATTTSGTSGYVLAYLNGVPTWTATTTLANISGTLAVNQGGTASTTLGGILAGNGTSAMKSAIIGTGLSFDGTTLTNTGVTSNSGDWGGTWQTFSPSHFQVAGSYLTSDPNWAFANSALEPTTTVGMIISASSTIGNGTQTGGLSISGGATTTGKAYFGGNVGIGTANPQNALDVNGGEVIGTYAGANSAGSGNLMVSNHVSIASTNDTSYPLFVNGSIYTSGQVGNLGTDYLDGSSATIDSAIGWRINFNINNNQTGQDFVVGSGSSNQSTNGTGALFVVQQAGNVGVNAYSPYSKFQVTGGGTGTGQTFGVVNGASTTLMQVLDNGNVGIGTTSPYAHLEVWGPDTASTSAFVVANSASTTEFSVFDTGNAVLAGSLTQNSDQRLKTNIQSLNASSSLAEIDALKPVTFNWIDPNKGPTPQLGFIAQQVEPIFPNLVSTTSATSLTPDGTLSLNYIDLISPIVSAIQALSADITSIENTIGGFAQSITTQVLSAATGNFSNELCVGSTCVTPAQFQAMVAAANQSGGSSSPPSSPDDSNSASTTPHTPPVIEINGDNPAVIQVGASYTDLGATITGPQADLNLGITTYVNGSEMNPVQIDTTTAATGTIAYVVTDNTGLTATSTRTVIIEAPSIVPTDDASTTATTTVQ